MKTVKEINALIGAQKEMMKESQMIIDNLAPEIAKTESGKEMISSLRGKIESSELQIKTLEAQSKNIAELELRKSNDWSKSPSSVVSVAWESTKKIHDQVSFSTNSKVNRVLRSALESSEEDRIATLLPGPTGSGKTTAVKWVAGELNIPVISQNYSGNMEEHDVIGGPTINQAGKVIMKDGPLTEAVRHGCVYVAEEMNFARPAVMAILNSLLDGNQQIVLPSGEIVKVAAGFKFVGTINPGYAGTREFNRALVNRFGTIIPFTRPTDTQLKAIVSSKTGYAVGKDKVEEENLNRLIVLMTTIEKLIVQDGFDAAISVRQLIASVRLLQDGETFKNAVKFGMINQVSNFDEELEAKMLTLTDKVAAADVKSLNKKDQEDK